MIRQAIPLDIEDMVSLLSQFHYRWGGLTEFDASSVQAMLSGLIGSPDGFVWRGRKSILAGSKEPVWFNHAQTEARELVWYAEDGNGLRLLRQFEKWADDAPVVMGASPLCDLSQVFKRRGYTVHDRIFRKAS